jgi:hypothetical protein
MWLAALKSSKLPARKSQNIASVSPPALPAGGFHLGLGEIKGEKDAA